jgi:hypothetical protein
MSLLLNTNKENFNVKSRDISKGLIKRTVCGMLQYPASAYQINVKKITVMILKGKIPVDRQKLVIYSTDVITALIACNAIKDIVLGGEFIITAEDILEKKAHSASLLNEGCLKAIPARITLYSL